MVSSSFIEAVKEGNIRKVRIMMKDSLLIDPTFKEFNLMEEKAKNMSGLYDAHDGADLSEDRTLWDEAYMNNQMVQMVMNFSHERVEHLKKVVRYLRQASSEDAKTLNEETKKTTHRKAQKRQGTEINGGVVIAGAVGGAVIGAAVAAIVDTAVVGGIVAGAVLGGVAANIAISTREGK